MARGTGIYDFRFEIVDSRFLPQRHEGTKQ
jgi:hypothetical protein